MKFKDTISDFLNYKKDYVRQSTLNSYATIYSDYLVPYFGEMNEIKQEEQ